jgi:ABC-type multidrug transport system fused ATPase/permease subunit
VSRRRSADRPSDGRESDALRTWRLVKTTAGSNRPFVLAFVALTLEALTAIFTPYPLSFLIDFLRGDRDGVVSGRNATVAVLTGGIIVLAALNSLADSLAEIYLARGGRLVGLNLRVRLYTHLQKLSLAFHDQRQTGDVVTRVTSDVGVIEQFITGNSSDLVGSVLVLTGTLVFLAFRSVQVTLVALLLVPLLAVVTNYFSQRIKAVSRQQRAREGDLASTAQEMLASIRVVQTFGRGGDDADRFAEQSRAAMDAALASAKLEAQFSWVVSVLQAVATSTIVWIGVYLIDRDALTVGTLVLFILLIQNMFKPTRRIIQEWGSIGKLYASVDRIAELLDRQPAVQDEPGAFDAPRLTGSIRFERVSFAYRNERDDGHDPDERPRLTLDDVDLSVAPGEMVALVGPSGAGKSTIAQLVPRLYDPHLGRVTIDGHDLRELTLASLRAQIGVVLQETLLFNTTVAGNIAYGTVGVSRAQIVAAAQAAGAHDFIEHLPEGYDTALTERATNLSGGQRQRIAIARAFVRDAPILILDEPTTGLDAEAADVVRAALQRLVSGKATLLISHDLQLVQIADRIVVLSAGRVVERGTHAELLARPGLYASLHARQVSGDAAPAEAAADRPRSVHVPSDDAPSDDDGARIRGPVFETMLMRALPLPVSPEVFRTMSPASPASPAPPPAVPRAPAPPSPPRAPSPTVPAPPGPPSQVRGGPNGGSSS